MLELLQTLKSRAQYNIINFNVSGDDVADGSVFFQGRLDAVTLSILDAENGRDVKKFAAMRVMHTTNPDAYLYAIGWNTLLEDIAKI